jgi:NitT/TauT family transport system substrate-binding protein
VLVGSGAWTFPNFGTTETAESITLGILPSETNALILIADEKGFFADNGLNVTIKYYDTGVAAIKDMGNDNVNISVTTEYPIVAEAFEKEKISVIGIIDKSQANSLIGRRDRGIENISDLKGKRIGVFRETVLEFYLGRFLDLHNMSIRDVTLVDVPPPQYVDSITNGSVDAIIAPPRYAEPIKGRLGNNGITWPAQSNQLAYVLLACQDDWVASHPKAINGILKSLDQAEEYAVDHPTEAKAIVQERLNFSDAYMAAIWPQHQFTLMLDRSLLMAMSDEGRWMIKNNLTTEKTLPYFRDYIYPEGLEEVKPESVNIR